MLTRKALWIPALAGAGLLIVLGVAGWSIDSTPVSISSSSSPGTSTTQSVSIVPTPEVADITVRTTSSATTTTTTTTTTQPKPPPVQAPPPPQQPTTTTEPPQEGLLVIENASCSPEGARGIDIRGQELICSKKNDRDRPRWRRA